jgi:hypothetical protein
MIDLEALVVFFHYIPSQYSEKRQRRRPIEANRIQSLN